MFRVSARIERDHRRSGNGAERSAPGNPARTFMADPTRCSPRGLPLPRSSAWSSATFLSTTKEMK